MGFNGLGSPKEAQKWSETSPKRSEMVWEQRAEKSSAMVWEKPKQAQKWSLGQAQKWSGRTIKSLEIVWVKPKKAQEWSSGMLRRSPNRLRNCPAGAQKKLRNGARKAQKNRNGLGEAQKTLGMVWGKFKTAQKWSGRSPKKLTGAGFRVFTFDTQRLDRLDGQCGPCLALERPAAPALGCTFSALRSLAKLGQLRALKCW